MIDTTTWPKRPIIYEINTWVWLAALSKAGVAPVTLGTVPKMVWDDLAALGVDAVWFMGVWKRSPAGIAVAQKNQGLPDDFRRALPDFTPADNVGSPYCVRSYGVDPHLGGPEGLAAARQELATRGLRLILDFVPNHVAPDHPWVQEHPDYFLPGSEDEFRQSPAAFIRTASGIFACGKDPYLPAWPDVLQLNAFSTGLRTAVGETVSAIAAQCDGVRCDMAMLVMNDVFEKTWGNRVGSRPTGDYWPELMATVRTAHPGFLFMAEAYWGLEWQLQQQGFDFCYDKTLYDRLVHDSAESVRLYLCADPAYQERLVRFIENHDEPRAAATFAPDQERAVAVAVTTLPGAMMLHEGQLEGRTVRLPVFLGRRPVEIPAPELRTFYLNLLAAIDREELRRDAWRLCDRYGWPDNQSYLNLVAWCWTGETRRHLIVVNLSDHESQARTHLPWDDLRGRIWRLTDVLTGATWDRSGNELAGPGLYVALKPWEVNFFRVEPWKKIT